MAGVLLSAMFCSDHCGAVDSQISSGGVRLTAAVCFSAAVASPALRARDEPLQPHDLWTAWELEPGGVIPLLISAVPLCAGRSPIAGDTTLER